MMDYQKIGNGLQVTGIGASALHMVGYLGKDYKSADITPDGCCPACKKKDLKQALRTYRISFEESIFLCENPQCIYPLGFEPISNIIIPVDSKHDPYQGPCRKRKLFDTSLVTSPSEPRLKLTRTNNLVDTEQTLKPNLAPKCNGDNLYETPSGQPDCLPVKQPDKNCATVSMEQKMDLGIAVQKSSPEILGVQMQLLPDSDICTTVSEILHKDSESLPKPLHLQWKNIHSLCWLDCILSALVHLGALQMILTGSVSENLSLIQRLVTEYKQAVELVNTCRSGEHTLEAPLNVMSRAESRLNEMRDVIFVQLQPLLKCTLGDEESPVFAFSLLLKKDPQIEELFLHSFSWKLECLNCGHRVNNRCQKTLTTFTNIIPEWHPLNAVHFAPCNKCNHMSQRRKMVLEKVSSVFMIHFVEGLPHNDLTTYSFQFQEDSYQVTAVIQYREVAKHFITWILNSDGTWLECDDLKGLYSSQHKNFVVPPSEVHIVIWERRTPQVTDDLNLQLKCEGTRNVTKAQPDSPMKCVDDKALDSGALVCHRENILNAHTNEMCNIVSNKTHNSLWGFNNQADDDIITLTLVNVPLDSEGKPLEDNHVMENNLIAEAGTLQQQDPGDAEVLSATFEREVVGNECLVLENTSAPLPQGQPNDASTTCIMSVVPLNNNSPSPETLPVQQAESKENLISVKNSSNSEPEKPQNRINRTKSGNNVLKLPNIVESTREITANSQISTPNSSSQAPHKNGTKAFVGSWVKGLLGKHPPFMPKSASISNKTERFKNSVKKEIDSTVLIKSASHFQGFQAKCSTQMKKVTEGAVDPADQKLPPSFPATSVFASLPMKRYAISKSGGTVTESAASLATKQFQPKQTCSENKCVLLGNVKESSTDEAHQMRLKLLQQLKAKKEKLASLDKLAKTRVRNRKSPKKCMKDQSQLGSQKENEFLQSLLKELQHQIDVEDGKSVNSPSTNMSQCSSSSYDDILSEILSPATTDAASELPQEEECRYLEMGGGSPKSPVPSAKPSGTQNTNNDHNYCSPVKENTYEGHRDLLAYKSPLKKLDFESPPKQDFLEDLLPNTMLNSIMADVEDLHHFDESLLSW